MDEWNLCTAPLTARPSAASVQELTVPVWDAETPPPKSLLPQRSSYSVVVELQECVCACVCVGGYLKATSGVNRRTNCCRTIRFINTMGCSLSSKACWVMGLGSASCDG